ncbi:hypothetical protein [Phenylobacterium sp.]|uniref:hypothetical protein n=1 Tax=Phenylobacterium sp. TaxID=1871053 RepID=UPI0025F6B66D|nr:hypothetical protein [Phenylobacterium sp.]
MAKRLGPRTVDSYVSNCNRVRKEVAVDLDTCDLGEVSLSNLRRQLEAAGVPPRSASDCLSAVRAYADFRQVPPAAPRSGEMRVTAEQREAWAANTATSPFNRWLDAQVRDGRGAFDLERLYTLAEQYGINKRAEYARLNAGQQRMNLGNMLRRVVPRSAYEDAKLPIIEPASPELPSAHEPLFSIEPSPAAHTLSAPESIKTASVRDLLLLYGQIMDELREREVVRTSNSPVGDYGELLFSRAFGWRLEGNSAAGHDATDEQGVRYQIKARRLTKANGSRQLSAIRRLHDDTFDHLAAVLFDARFKVLRAIVIPHALVASQARRREHTNSWLFVLEDRVWLAPGVRDVTAELAVAAAAL